MGGSPGGSPTVTPSCAVSPAGAHPARLQGSGSFTLRAEGGQDALGQQIKSKRLETLTAGLGWALAAGETPSVPHSDAQTCHQISFSKRPAEGSLIPL